MCRCDGGLTPLNMPATFTIQQAHNGDALAAFKALCAEYAASLQYTSECASLEHQGIDDELASLPGRYAPPAGRMLIALDPTGTPVGCVALRPLETGICEMKRMYIRPAVRGQGLGRELAVAIINAARETGYGAMRLDTGATMTAAASLYTSLGFRDIPPYNRDPTPGTRWMELRLDG